ncbi:asparagine synthase-related protein [Streptomyces cacaoi]
MHEEWISTAGTEGSPVGLPGVRVGTGCPVQAIANRQVRILLAGDFPLPGPQARRRLLDAATAGRWEELTQLPGSYWVAAHDSAERQFVSGDLSGFRSIFYTSTGRGTAWSTSARHLAEARGAAPDLPLLAARIAAGPQHWPDRTAWEGVRAVPGGCGLLLQPSAEPRLVDVTARRQGVPLDEGAPAFAGAVQSAVNWRLRAGDGTAGADVSGGLDSSSLAILASRTGTVCAVTYADAYTSDEDLTYARRTAEHIGARLHVGTGGREELPFGWTLQQPLTDQPVAAALTNRQHQLYLRPAAGLPFHLTGNGGDVVLDSCSAAWVGMVQSGRRREARRQVTGWARARNRAPRDLWQAVTRAAGSSRAEALNEAAWRLRRGVVESKRPGVWAWCHLGQFGTWLTAEGRETVAALLEEAARSRLPGQSDRADIEEQTASLRLNGGEMRDTSPLAAEWGVRQVHPFLDNQVVRAAFAMPPAERHGITTFKPLLGRALPELPAWLTSRHSKGSFGRQALAGMRAHRTPLADLIRSSALTTSGLMDPDRAVNALARVGDVQADALYDLQRLAMTCQWLAHHAAGTPLAKGA